MRVNCPDGAVPSRLEDGTGCRLLENPVVLVVLDWPMVHVDDLARAYVAALEHAPVGTLLNVASGEGIRLRELALLASRAAGIPGLVQPLPLEQARTLMGPFADALVLDQQVSGAKAQAVLGWTPTAPSVVEELEQGSYAEPR